MQAIWRDQCNLHREVQISFNLAKARRLQRNLLKDREERDIRVEERRRREEEREAGRM